MDRATQHKLNKIQGKIPAHLRNNLVREEVDTSEEDLARAALKNPSLNRQSKNRIAKLLHQGAFRRSDSVIDQAVVAEIEKINEREVKKLYARGELPDPQNDPFIKKRQRRINERNV